MIQAEAWYRAVGALASGPTRRVDRSTTLFKLMVIVVALVCSVQVGLLAPTAAAGDLTGIGQLYSSPPRTGRERIPQQASGGYFYRLSQRYDLSIRDALRAYQEALRYGLSPEAVLVARKLNGSWEKALPHLSRYHDTDIALARVEAVSDGDSRTPEQRKSEIAWLLASAYNAPFEQVMQLLDLNVYPAEVLDFLFAHAVFRRPMTQLMEVLNRPGKSQREWLLDICSQVGLKPRWAGSAVGHSQTSVQDTLAAASGSTYLGLPVFNSPGFSLASPTEEQGSIGGVSAQSTSSDPGLIDPSAVYNAGRVSLFQVYFKGTSETINPQTCELLIFQEDLRVPGPNGMDIVIERVFHSQQALLGIPSVHIEYDIPQGDGTFRDEYMNVVYSYNYLVKRWGIGAGWGFNFPSIEVGTPDNPYAYFLHMGDGRVYKVDRDGGIYDHELLDMRFERPSTSPYTSPQGIAAVYQLAFKDGTIWYFADDGVPLAKQDRYGNRMVFAYSGSSGSRVLTSITSGSRTVTISRVPGLVDISYSGRTIRYQVGNVNGFPRLDAVTLPLIGTTRFVYRYEYIYFTFDPYDSPRSIPILNLAEIQYPTGGKTVYTYAKAKKDLTGTDVTDPNPPSYLEFYLTVVREDQTSERTGVNRVEWEYYPYAAPSGWEEGAYWARSKEVKAAWDATTGSTLTTVYSYASNHTLQALTRRYDGYIEKASYTYNANRLPIRSETVISTGESSASYWKEYSWDKYGNLLAEHDAIGKETLREYERQYHQQIFEAAKVGDDRYLTTAVELDEMSRPATVRVQLQRPIGPTEYQETFRHEFDWIDWDYEELNGEMVYMAEFTTPGEVEYLELEAIYDLSGYNEASYRAVLYARPAGSGEDWTYYGAIGGYFFAGDNPTVGGTFRSEVLPLDTYEVRVVSGWPTPESCAVSGGIIPVSAQWNPVDSKAIVTTYQYSTTHPWNITAISKRLDEDSAVGQAVSKSFGYSYEGTFLTEVRESGRIEGMEREVTTSAIYDAFGQITSLTTSDGLRSSTTSYTYDGIGRLTSVTYPDGSQKRWTYNDVARTVTISPELGSETTEFYDQLGWFIQATRDAVTVARVDYDSLGRVIQELDANNHGTSYRYDARGRKTRVYRVDAPDDPTPTLEVTISYDDIARTQTITDANGYWTKVMFDTAGRKIEESRLITKPAQSETVRYQYDLIDRVLKVTDGKGQVFAYQYGLWDQPVSLDVPGTIERVHTYSYDARGNKVYEDGTVYTYDGMNRLIEVTYPDGLRAEYQYDKDGNLIQADLYSGLQLLNQVTVSYDSRGRKTRETWMIDSTTYSLGYAYDATGNLTSIQYPDGMTVTMGYDDWNRLAYIPGYFGTGLANRGFEYDNANFMTRVNPSNGVYTLYTADIWNRPVRMDSPALTLGYSYDPAGNVRSITKTVDGIQTTLNYTYDGANRLLSAEVALASGKQTVTYTYDLAGNRTSETWSDGRSVSYTYSTGNYLTARDSTTYTWDEYGRLDSKHESDSFTDYIWDAAHRLVEVAVDGRTVARFYYDPLGRRVKIVEGDTTTITLYSGNDIVYEVKTKPGQPTVTTKYLAINGKYLAKVVQEGTNQPQTYFYHVDLVGSVRAITDSQGQVVARFEYEPFGVTVQASGPLAGEEIHKFTGKPEDAAIDLYYFNARYYDTLTGRFTTKDPSGNGPNYWQYCLSNPLIRVDPDGNDSYVLYDPLNFKTQAAVEAQRLALAYGTSVHMIPVTSEEAFKEAWSSMDQARGIEGVSLLFHGSAQTMNINYETRDYLTALPSGLTPKGNAATYIGDLPRKTIWELNILTCEGGDFDISPNVADAFLAHQNVPIVRAMDGKLSYTREGHPRMARLSQIEFVIKHRRLPAGLRTIYNPNFDWQLGRYQPRPHFPALFSGPYWAGWW